MGGSWPVIHSASKTGVFNGLRGLLRAFNHNHVTARFPGILSTVDGLSGLGEVLVVSTGFRLVACSSPVFLFVLLGGCTSFPLESLLILIEIRFRYKSDLNILIYRLIMVLA